MSYPQQTTKPSKEVIAQRVAAMRAFHEPVFKALGITDAKFYPKTALNKNGVRSVSLFNSEVRSGDFYLEFTNFDYETVDLTRTLWKHRYNPEFHTEYATEGNGDTMRYLVPVDELQAVQTTSKDVQKMVISTMEDDMMDKLSIRDLYSIIQNKPVSMKSWLNDLIKANQ